MEIPEMSKFQALNLMNFEKNEEIINYLKGLGVWDKSECWRYLGDTENNYSSIGNQQSHPVASLVEKVVNDFDAVILNVAKEMGLDLYNITDVKKTKDEIYRKLLDDVGGDILELSKLISVSMTGLKSPNNPNVTIADRGEGQTPKSLPETILSLGKSNKIRIPIVQGKHNMGGSGVAKFTDLQILVSRKNPALVDLEDSTGDEWGITIVRRTPPTGNMRSSVIEYLAPIDADVNPKKGGIISFKADTMPIMPGKDKLCETEVEYGTFIKLFNYDIGSYKTSILVENGLGHALKLHLPEMFVPIRICEFRDYKMQGGRNVYAVGLTDHIKSRGEDILEPNFPIFNTIKIGNESIAVTTYVFKKDKFSKFLRSTGVIFVLNGQTHAMLDKRIYSKNSIKLNEISKDTLTVVDCSKLSNAAIEELFMNSRDRLVDTSFSKEVLKQLESHLSSDVDLKAINEIRIQDLIKDKITDNKPLANALSKVLKNNDVLSKLLDLGVDVNATKSGRGNDTLFSPLGDEFAEVEFKPKDTPTVFKMHRVNVGESLKGEVQLTKKIRVTFTTDARNDLLSGQSAWDTSLTLSGISLDIPHQLKLKNGIGKLCFDLPSDVRVGDILNLTFKLFNEDQTIVFENLMVLNVIENKLPRGNGGGRTKGGKNKPKTPVTTKSNLQLPKIVEVTKADWAQYSFNNSSVLKITKATDEYIFCFNIDNKILKSEVNSANRAHKELVKQKFIYGMTMLALSAVGLIPESENLNDDNVNTAFHSLEDVEKICAGFAPFIIPTLNMINALTFENYTEVA